MSSRVAWTLICFISSFLVYTEISGGQLGLAWSLRKEKAGGDDGKEEWRSLAIGRSTT